MLVCCVNPPFQSKLVCNLGKNTRTDSKGEQQTHLCWGRKCDDSTGRQFWSEDGSLVEQKTETWDLPQNTYNALWVARLLVLISVAGSSCNIPIIPVAFPSWPKNVYCMWYSSLVCMVPSTAVTCAKLHSPKHLEHLLGTRRKYLRNKFVNRWAWSYLRYKPKKFHPRGILSELFRLMVI